MKSKPVWLLGTGLYAVALLAMFLPHAPFMTRTPVVIEGAQGRAPFMTRTPVVIEGAQGRPSHGTVWQRDAPRAVMLIGHGVTSNQGIMATLGKAFARNGYAAVVFDFWGHGRSRERFNWHANPDQIQAWVAWARHTYPDLPVAYLGHSMGGFAGSDAFHEEPTVDAFVSLGALPRNVPSCDTAVAAGIFEELFTIAQARERMGDRATVISSPLSNHAIETSDPLLILRIIRWVNTTLGFETNVVFPWIGWALSLFATALGGAGALLLAAAVAGIASTASVAPTPRAVNRRWSVNPYRVAALLFGARGVSTSPRACTLGMAALRGLIFGGVTALLLALLLDIHIFTVSMTHAGRLLTWLILTPPLALVVFLDAWALERVPLRNARVRFAVAALTRAVPLLALSVLLRLLYFPLAFLCMMLGIYAFVLVMLALVHAMATRAASDWRAGATAAALLFAWVIAFWFPLYWPWV